MVEQYHHARVGQFGTNVADEFENSPAVVTQPGADEQDVGTFAPHQAKNLGLSRRCFDDVELSILGQRFDQQLCAHGGAVGSENPQPLLIGLIGQVA